MKRALVIAAFASLFLYGAALMAVDRLARSIVRATR